MKFKIEIGITLAGGSVITLTPAQEREVHRCVEKIVFGMTATKKYTKVMGNRPWTKEEDKLVWEAQLHSLKGAALTKAAQDIAQKVGRTPKAVSIRARKLEKEA